jgi:hypothetical protein
MDGEAYEAKSELQVLLPGIQADIKDKVALDFGCGPEDEGTTTGRRHAPSCIV